MNTCCIKTAKRIMSKLDEQLKTMDPEATKGQGCQRCKQYVTVTVKVE